MPKPRKQLRAVVRALAQRREECARGPTDFTRQRKLPLETLILTILNMQGNTLNNELALAFPDMTERMTASAFVQAKGKLKPEALRAVLDEFNATAPEPSVLKKARSYRVYAIDSTTFNFPYSPDSRYAVDKSGWKNRHGTAPAKNMSEIHACMLYNVLDGQIVDCVIQDMGHQDERKAALEMLGRLDKSTPFIVIFDRGYCSFNFIEHLRRMENCKFLVRTKAGQTRQIRDLPDAEIDMPIVFEITTKGHRYAKNRKRNPRLHYVPIDSGKKTRSPDATYSQWDFEEGAKIPCRLVKTRINDPDSGREEFEVLLTNLGRLEFPAQEIKKLYHSRWTIEVAFRSLKYSVGAVNFHSRKESSVLMELYASLVMFNLASRVMAMAVVKAKGKYEYRIDFRQAVRIVREDFRRREPKPPGELLAEVQAYVQPVRPGRADKRNLKLKSYVGFGYRVA